MSFTTEGTLAVHTWWQTETGSLVAVVHTRFSSEEEFNFSGSATESMFSLGTQEPNETFSGK